jgi:hypothetical protein
MPRAAATPTPGGLLKCFACRTPDVPWSRGSCLTSRRRPWEAGQHQPDRVAAAVVAYDALAHAVTEPMHIVTPIDAARRAREGRMPPPPAWMRRRIGG